MKPGRHIVVLLTLLAMLRGGVPTLAAQDVVPAVGPVAVTTEVTASFPQGLTFSTSIPLPAPDARVDAVQLLYRIATDPTVNLEIVPTSDFSVARGEVSITTFVDLLAGFVPVGVDLTFTWEVLLDDGSVIETGEEATQWRDTRFDWDLRETEQVRLYSYGASDDFAWTMANESQGTIDELEMVYGLEAMPPLSIWIYQSYSDFHGTLQGNSRESIAGVSFLGMDTIVAVVPDGDDAEYGRVIPHEISHHAVFEATRDAIALPPLWFNEGLAVHTQVGGTAHFAEMVAKANEAGTLFDIRALETSFPYQPAQATLAYASSWSAVSYIESTWGTDGIARLMDAFASDLPADEAVRQALGVSMDELNDGWKLWVSMGSPTG